MIRRFPVTPTSSTNGLNGSTRNTCTIIVNGDAEVATFCLVTALVVCGNGDGDGDGDGGGDGDGLGDVKSSDTRTKREPRYQTLSGC